MLPAVRLEGTVERWPYMALAREVSVRQERGRRYLATSQARERFWSLTRYISAAVIILMAGSHF